MESYTTNLVELNILMTVNKFKPYQVMLLKGGGGGGVLSDGITCEQIAPNMHSGLVSISVTLVFKVKLSGHCVHADLLD